MSDRVVGVIGSGTMGAGIAQAAASAGFLVETLDTEPARVKTAYATLAERLERRVQRGRLPGRQRDAILARLRVAEGFACLKRAACVIEAVPEDASLKKKVLAEAEKAVSPRALLASNTSSLSITELAGGLKRPDRFLGMHFFNPAPIMKLVELVRGPATDDQALVDARAICTRLDKTPVVVKDSPGFIGNRVNRPFYLEALRLLEDGEANVASIDAAMREVGGFRMGPFELLDLIGIDVNLRVTETVHENFGHAPRFAPSALQKKLVADGHLGRKTGRGFYGHGDGEPVPAWEGRLRDAASWRPSPALRAFAGMLSKPADRATWIYSRVFLAVVNEAALAADSIASPRDVDLAMELGFHYPQGPLAAADHVGLDVVRDLLAEFFEESGRHERFKANPLLERLVAEGHLGEKTARGFLYHAL